ncbi:MAG: putative MORN repeat protein, partial [Streblomastix strix]
MNFKYVGQILHHKPHGSGKYCFSNEFYTYDGDWENGKMHGHGRMQFGSNANDFYDGEFYMGEIEGEGIRVWSDGRKYQGQWKNGERSGFGIYERLRVNADQTVEIVERYEGMWNHNAYSGNGLLSFINGTIYEGQFRNHKLNGHAHAQYPNGDEYFGEWLDGKPNGEGLIRIKLSGLSYEGYFHDGEFTESTQYMEVIEPKPYSYDLPYFPIIESIPPPQPPIEDDIDLLSDDEDESIDPKYMFLLSTLNEAIDGFDSRPTSAQDKRKKAKQEREEKKKKDEQARILQEQQLNEFGLREIYTGYIPCFVVNIKGDKRMQIEEDRQYRHQQKEHELYEIQEMNREDEEEKERENQREKEREREAEGVDGKGGKKKKVTKDGVGDEK